MEKKRIAIVCQAWVGDSFGGAFKFASEFAAYLADQGHDVHYVCGADEPAAECEEKGALKIWRYAYPKAKSPNPKNLLGHIRGAKRIIQNLDTEKKLDVINAHSPLQAFGALQYGRRNGARTVYSMHSPLYDEMCAAWPEPRKLKHQLAIGLLHQVELNMLRYADAVQTFSQFMGGLAKKRHPDTSNRVHPLKGWVDLSRFKPVKDRQALRQEISGVAETDKPLFFTLRRLEKRMGLDRLIEACGLLKDAGMGFRLLIGGGGSQKEALQKQIDALDLKDLVFLLGRVSDEDLPSYYAAADAFVLPTLAMEGFGIIIMESYACATPVIGTPIGAIPETMGPVGADWVAEDTTTEALFKKMAAYLKGELKTDADKLIAHAQGHGIPGPLKDLETLCMEEPA